MAWQDVMVPILRWLINDVESGSLNVAYGSDRLEEVITVAAHLSLQDVTFDFTYTIDIESQSISPDPTANSDTVFINLVTMKAACLIDTNTLRAKAVLSGLVAKAGPAVLQTEDHLRGFLAILEHGPCKAYDELKIDYMFGSGKICRAVLSPFISNDFNPENLSRSAGTIRERY